MIPPARASARKRSTHWAKSWLCGAAVVGAGTAAPGGADVGGGADGAVEAGGAVGAGVGAVAQPVMARAASSGARVRWQCVRGMGADGVWRKL